MNEEHFDVVDERDEIVGKAPRAEVHNQGLRHRAVHILLFNAKGQVFLQKRSSKKDTFPGAWDSSAAGHLDCGEDYDVCALRELREELGYTPPEPLRRLFKLKACPETGCEFIWVYEGRGEGPFTLHPEEIDRGEWFEPEEVTRWLRQDPGDFASGFRVLWSKMVDAGTVS
jgi:isopentenyl-diphosphate delta-isomerase type 1